MTWENRGEMTPAQTHVEREELIQALQKSSRAKGKDRKCRYHSLIDRRRCDGVWNCAIAQDSPLIDKRLPSSHKLSAWLFPLFQGLMSISTCDHSLSAA